jgi:hypothetical protein
MFAVEIYAAVRKFVFIEGNSRREAARVFGLSRDTIAKMCRYSAPPGYVRSKPPVRPKLGPLVPVIDAILASDKSAPPKQRHTAKRIFERLRIEHGYIGGYGFRDVLVKGFVDEIVIFHGTVEIARHPRSYDRSQFVFEPRHYLALLEQKPGALDQAAPLQGWTLPEPLQHLRRLLEARMGNRGKREFIQVLRLMEVFSETIVANAALDAIRLNAIGFDAVKQLVIARVERRPARLDLTAYPYLPAPSVRTTAAADYAVLVSGRAA